MKTFKTIFLTACSILSFSIMASSALAQSEQCKSLWIERNAIFKDVGYCFGSELAQGVFGNAGCVTKSPSFPPATKRKIESIVAQENSLSCVPMRRNWQVNDMRPRYQLYVNARANTQRGTPTQQSASTQNLNGVSCNQDGYVVPTANTSPVYLGRSCDAFQETVGQGTWCWNQQGISMTFAQGKAQLAGTILPNCHPVATAHAPCACDQPKAPALVLSPPKASSQAEVRTVSNAKTPDGIPEVRNHAVIAANFSVASEYENLAFAWADFLSRQMPLYAKHVMDLPLVEKLVIAERIFSDQQRLAFQAASGQANPIFLTDARQDKENVSAQSWDRQARKRPFAIREQWIRNFVKDHLDEFTKPAFEQTLNPALQSRLVQGGGQFPIRTVQIFTSMLGEYDFEGQHFELDSVRGAGNSEAAGLASIRLTELLQNAFPGLQRFAISSDVEAFPKELSMNPQQAQNTVNLLNSLNKDGFRRVYVAVFADLGEVTITAQKDDSARLGYRQTGSAALTVDRIEIWADKKGTQVLAAIKPQKFSDTLAKERDLGRKFKLSLFGNEFIAITQGHDLTGQDGGFSLDALIKHRVDLERRDFQGHLLPQHALIQRLRSEIVNGRERIRHTDKARFEAYYNAAKEVGVAREIIFPFQTTAITPNTLYPSDSTEFIGAVLTVNASELIGSRYTGLHGGIDAGQHVLFPIGGYGLVRLTKNDLARIGQITVKQPLRTRPEPNAQSVNMTGYKRDTLISGYLMLEMGAPKPFEPGANTRLRKQGRFLYDARPIAVVLNDQGQKVTIDLRGTDGRAQAQGAENILTKKPAAISSGSVPFDAMHTDLRLVREFGEGWDLSEYVRMMLARWNYEQSFTSASSQPVGGRFFDFGAPKPEGAELEKDAEKFRAWSIALARSLPSEYSMRLRHVPSNKVGAVRIGQWATDQNLRKFHHRNCNQLKNRLQREGTLRADQVNMLENACTYIMQADKYQGGYSVFGEPRFLDPNQRQAYAKGPSFLREYSRFGTTGFRGACQKLTRKEPYCVGLHNALQSVHLVDETYVLDDIFVFDKMIDFTPRARAEVDQFKSSSRQRYNYEMRFEIERVEKVDTLLAPLVARASEQAQDFLISQGLQDARNTAGQNRPHYETPPAYVYYMAVKSVNFVEEETGKVVANIPLRAHFPKPDEQLLTPLERVFEAPPSEPYGLDIVGLRVGMSFDEADKIIREHMDVGTVKFADRKWNSQAAFGNVQAFTSGVLYESKDRNERIVLYDEKPSAQDVVLGIVRTVAWPKGQVSAADVSASLTNKYGQPADATGEGAVWGAVDRRCNQVFRYYSGKGGIWRNADGSEDGWSVRGLVNDVPVPDDIHRFNPKPDCEFGLMAGFDTRSNSWDVLHIRAFDKGVYSRQFLQSQDILKNGGQREDAPEPAKTGSNKVKL